MGSVSFLDPLLFQNSSAMVHQYVLLVSIRDSIDLCWLCMIGYYSNLSMIAFNIKTIGCVFFGVDTAFIMACITRVATPCLLKILVRLIK
jgi:K+ transporter